MASSYFRGFNKLFKFGKSRGEDTGRSINTIVGVKPKVNKSKIQKNMSDLNITVLKSKGKMKKQTQDFDGAIRKVQTKIGQTSQKLRGEPVTKSGFTKGKDLKKVEKKANGGRIGRKFGSPKPKTNVEKIKETFAPKKKLSPKQMKIAKLAGNPNKIDGADFKKLRGKA